jgi:hypothetical protein
MPIYPAAGAVERCIYTNLEKFERIILDLTGLTWMKVEVVESSAHFFT